MPAFFIALFVTAMVVAAIWSHFSEQRRCERMQSLAFRLGLRYSPDRNSGLASELSFLDMTQRGSNPYAYDVIFGTYRKQNIMAFNFHYETHTLSTKGVDLTEHYYFSFFILKLPRRFPELRIGPEGFLSKIAETFGYDAIGFESHEFSSLFCVRSPDKKFAYDICHARMIEYLLANRDLNIEIDGSVLAVCFENTMEIDKIERELNRLIEIRTLMPDYLFEDGAQ